MKRIIWSTVLLLAGLLLVPTVIQAAGVPFFSASVEEGKAIAARENKLLFVHFTASWCMPCQWLEQNTFQDYNLSRFVERNVVSIKSDVDDFQGFRDKETYDIEQLPSFLIFSPTGQLLTRVEKTMSANELLDLLQKYNAPGYKHASRPMALANGGAPSSGTDHLNKPALVTSPNQPIAQKKYTPVPDPAISSTSLSTQNLYADNAMMANPPTLQEREYAYSSPSNTVQPKSEVRTYYGVQVGVFSNYENAIPFIAKLEGHINTKADLFRNDKDYQKTIFKVVVGKFTSEEQADRFKKALEAKGFKGEVKELSGL